ncbi:MAG: molybdopterin-dependent oxidoreductase [Chloroflexota bacterium]
MENLTFTLNGQLVTVRTDPARSLLEVLRHDLGLTGAKQGCDFEGECGACTVLLDGAPVRACLTPAAKVAGRRVLTIEGLGSPENLHPLQVAFIESGAVQCGYCTPGMLLAARALLDREPSPTRGQIVEALEGNLCRCTGYSSIVRAVELAAARLRGEQASLLPFSDRPFIGGSELRSDSVEKVTGRARYVEDMVLPGMLYGQVLRSPHHHARLLSVDTSEAARLPGVIRVLTAADVPGRNSFAAYSRDEPVLPLPGETVRMRGAPVVLVVARSIDQARAGVEAVRVAYDPLAHAFHPAETLAEGALPIYPTGNVLTSEVVLYGDLEAVLAASDVALEATYSTSYLEHAALERESVLGYLDEAGRVTVVAGNHQPHWAQGYIAEVLALPPEGVRVIVPPTGGSFGGKQDPWPLIAAALMVYHVRVPVRLVYTRRESFDASPKRHPYRMDYTVGAMYDGRLTGFRARIDINTGGYDAHGQYIPNYAVTASGGAYRWQAADSQARSIFTNGPKAGQFRGFGTSQSTFALECVLDELAAQLGHDPLEFRLKNVLRQSEVSFLGYPVAESLGYAQVLEAVRPAYRAWMDEAESFNAAQGANGAMRKGVGLAGMWYRFGKSGSLCCQAHAELALDGRLVVYCSAPDYGQGTNTVMSQLAAEVLGVSRDQIQVVNADTALTPDSGIQGASRATFWVGGAVIRAASQLKSAIQAAAAEMLDCPPDDLLLAEGRVISQREPSRSVSLSAVAYEFDRMGQPRKVVGMFDLSPLYPSASRPEYVPYFVTGAQAAEVVVNLHTGEVRVTRLVAAHDVGRAVNPLDARGQIEGAVLMGLGAALMEEVIPGASTGLSDYYLPTARSMPDIQVILVEVPGFHGPYGVKGLGEAAMLPTTPAIINAVSRAIGARLRQIPATPERVLQAHKIRMAW